MPINKSNLIFQILSTTVANAMSYLNQEDTMETEKFIRYMDKFFDCLNVRSLSEGTNKLKPNLFPYRKATDDRLMVSVPYPYYHLCHFILIVA